MINQISFNNFKGDLFGGLSAAVISLPLALAFGVATGAGAAAGVYGAILVGLFASLFGGTKTLISEPTGPMSVVFTVVIADMIASNPENGMAMAFTVVMMAGVFQIVLSKLKLGRYITMMPHSVVSGFMSGIGCILILIQLAPLLGTKAPEPGVMGTVLHLPQILSSISLPELLLSSLALAVLFLTPKKLRRKVPPQLLALVLLSIIGYVFFGDNQISRVGAIDVGLPALQLPTFALSELDNMLVDALILGALGCIDSMLTSLIADNLTKEDHDSDKELTGQGIGNLVSGLFGGLPGAGATMGTVVNIQTGGTTILSGVLRALILALAVFLLTDLIALIPVAVLAAIALKVGLDILDWSFIKRAHKVSRHTAMIMYLVLFITVFIDLILAVGIGLFIANIVTIEKLSAAQQSGIKTITTTDDELKLSDNEQAVFSLFEGKLLLVYLSGPMMFGLSRAMSRQHRLLSGYRYVVMDISDVSFIDDTIALTIENAITDAKEHDVELLLVHSNNVVSNKLDKLGVLDLVPRSMVFSSRESAFSWLKNKAQVEQNHLTSLTSA
ncbi:SulP family inorganic anion transporter [Thalassotalea ponticola]|uniref:SulP family inorganic anion transporter n=1 Tax=Thalassotalea ponticola TaxID=1523392 RepID=UPI0025B38221|nr:SulP family inorganic anion transporter [Thalassotalea ponticola]MDN3652439.1 SulP family inorganic anion transporter [Thalassotalea ponticola]